VTSRGGERPHGSHLGSLVSAYVDRDLPAGVLLACDQHLGVCGSCRAVAEEERRLMESMRRALAPHPSSSLQSALLGLADHPAPTTCRPHLPVVQRGAPPLHRSPVRAAVLAGLAAGASAAAAVSLGVAGVGAVGPSAPGSGPPASAATVRGPQAPVPPHTGTTPMGFVPAAAVLPIAGARPPAASAGPSPSEALLRLTQSRHD
jgi:hypothetical protein